MRAVVLLALLGVTLSVSAAPAPLPKRTRGDAGPNWPREYVAAMGEAIVKAARTGPKKIELNSYHFEKAQDRSGKDLKIVVFWLGGITKKMFTSTIVVKLARSGGRWLVLDV